MLFFFHSIGFITILQHKRLCFTAGIITPVTLGVVRTFSCFENVGAVAVEAANFFITCHVRIIADISGLTHFPLFNVHSLNLLLS